MKTLSPLGLAALFAALSSTAGWSGQVSIVPGPEPDSIQLTAQDASLTEILTSLGSANGFTVEGSVHETGLRSGRWVGPLKDVMTRLLKQQNYVLSGDQNGRRLVLTGSKPGSTPSNLATSNPAPPAPEAPNRLASDSTSKDVESPAAMPSAADAQTVAAGAAVAAENAAMINSQFGYTNGVASSSIVPSDPAGLAFHVTNSVQALAASLQTACVGCSSQLKR